MYGTRIEPSGFLSYRALNGWIFLGAFAKLRKATIRFVVSVCPSARLPAWSNSARTERIVMKFVLSIFIKSVDKIQGSLKYDKNSR